MKSIAAAHVKEGSTFARTQETGGVICGGGLYIYVYMHVCMHTYVYIYLYPLTHICIHTHIYIERERERDLTKIEKHIKI